MNKGIKFILGILILILLIQNASALGVTPGRTNIDFTPKLERTVSFTVINSDHKDVTLLAYVRGELNESIKISGPNRFSMSSDEESKQMEFDVKLPKTLTPGLHTAEVVVLEIPAGSEGEGTSVGSAIAVVTQVHVFVPYPGKYIEADVKVSGDEVNKKFTVIMRSRGEELIAKASAEIQVVDSTGKVVKKLETSSVSLAKDERKEISADWEVDAPYGKYVAQAVITYDREVMKLAKEFSIGELVLDLLQVKVNNFKLGGIAKFEMIVKNKWNEVITNAYAEMRVFDSNMNEMDSFKTAAYDIPGGVQTTMVDYWDTKDVVAGVYDANVILYYADKKTQQDLKLDVREDEIVVMGLGYVISEKSGGGIGKNLIIILVVALVVLVLVNLAWFFMLRKRVSANLKKE